LQRRSDAVGLEWTVVSLHPGAVATDLGRNVFGTATWEKLQAGDGTWWEISFLTFLSLFVITVEQGASTQVWLASRTVEAEKSRTVDKGSGDAKGGYFVDCTPRELQAFAFDRIAAQDLWVESEAKSGVSFVLRKTQEAEVEARDRGESFGRAEGLACLQVIVQLHLFPWCLPFISRRHTSIEHALSTPFMKR
jgi:hypothetical protein